MKKLIAALFLSLSMLVAPAMAADCEFPRVQVIEDIRTYEASKGVKLEIVADTEAIFAVKVPNQDLYLVSFILPGDCLSKPFLATGDQLYKQFGILIN
jgi:hypothetical protein